MSEPAISEASRQLRDELITKARYGKITPEQAEAEAKAAGLLPFEIEPDICAFDPMKQSRWPMVMAVAWIAWRDPQLVMEQGAEFRSRSTLWIFRDWTELIDEGKDFARRAGWFLESWHEATTGRLGMVDARMTILGEKPASAPCTPAEAETVLWQFLQEEHLLAEGFDQEGKLVEIPPREWAHLKLFEDGKRDVLRYDALDRNEPYSNVRFRRKDLMRLWPPDEAKAKAESACRRWLVLQMHDLPAGRTKSKKQFEQEAVNKFRPLAVRQFQRAWDLAIEEALAPAWKKAGRPLKKIKSPHQVKS